MKIILDGFGGDHAPVQVLAGARMAADAYGATLLITGDADKLRDAARRENISMDGIQLHHAPDVIDVEEDPATIIKEHADSSMAAGMRLLAEGEGDAFVSAGSTGALVMGSSLIVKRIKGVKRATLATVIPTPAGCYLLTDAGANTECRPEMLVQFGVMGSAYMERVMGVASPKVGLINIGAESNKGLELQVKAHELMRRAPFRFVGNVEAREIPKGAVDVAVADGFTGNIVLKLTEGLGSAISGQIKDLFVRNLATKFGALFLLKGINEFKASMDYTEYGGAPLLGISKPVIKAHGSSNANAFKNAIRQARACVERNVTGEIESALLQLKGE